MYYFLFAEIFKYYLRELKLDNVVIKLEASKVHSYIAQKCVDANRRKRKKPIQFITLYLQIVMEVKIRRKKQNQANTRKKAKNLTEVQMI